jgi:hypothetical protein
MYYPLKVQGSMELSVFEKISISPYYLSFVDRQTKTGATSHSFEQYDDDQFFESDGYWEYGSGSDDDYWDYLDDYEETGESPYITFDSEPQIRDDGTYGFTLNENGINNTASISAIVYMLTEDMEYIIELGETVDFNGDWSTGEFYDNFDGYWLSLPDGQNLATYIAEETDDYVVYTSPIILNYAETNLRIKQYYSDGHIEVEGAWGGVSEDGIASREIIKIESGDIITPCYYEYALESDFETVFKGSDYKVTGDLEIQYGIMDEGLYMYAFDIDDIYGDYYISDPAAFSIDENGDVAFEEY